MSTGFVAAAAVVVSAGVSAYSSNKASKRAAAAADRSTRAALTSHEQTLERNDDLVRDAARELTRQRADIKTLHRDTETQLARAFRDKDQAEITRLSELLDGYESQYQDLASTIDAGQEEQNSLLADGDKDIERIREEDLARLDAGAERTEASINNMNVANDATMGELQNLQAAGDRPVGLDAAQSEIESGYRDAEARLRRNNGGQVSEGSQLAMAMGKTRDLGSLSGNMRKNWTLDKANAVGNLSGAVSSGERNILSADASMRSEQSIAAQQDFARRDTNNARRIESGERFLDRKLDSKAQNSAMQIAAKDQHAIDQSNRDMQLTREQLDNDARNLALNDAALGNYQDIQQGAMGVAANANTAMSGIYGNIAAANIQSANANAAQASSAIANLPTNAINAYGAATKAYNANQKP